MFQRSERAIIFDTICYLCLNHNKSNSEFETDCNKDTDLSKYLYSMGKNSYQGIAFLYSTHKSSKCFFLEFIFSQFHNNPNIDMESVFQLIKNKKFITRCIYRYYFHKELPENLKYKNIGNEINHLKNSDGIKFSIMNYFYSYEYFMENALYSFKEVYQLVDAYHTENIKKIDNLQGIFMKRENLKVYKEQYHNFIHRKKLILHVSFINCHVIQTNERSDKFIDIIIGSDFQQTLEKARCEKMNLISLGKVLSSPTRVKILEFIAVHGKVSIRRICDTLAIAESTTREHLWVMLNELAIKSIKIEKKTHYYINEEYPKIITKCFERMCDKAE